jgi:2-polyprenyl-3-methyl-5-hydroxy-6-metoxy-1,4-benzoquinol methylase
MSTRRESENRVQPDLAEPALDDYLRANHALWDGRAEPHFESEFYGVEAFRKGACSLTHIELEALGDVRGKTMLHLQCHFGQDTLSWARRGANVTGVDFSAKAIALARRLSDELKLPAEFICSDVYELPQRLDRQFDVVFTSYGVLKWLPDLAAWARTVERYLRPGGTFFLVEFHPFLYVFDYERAERVEHSYFYDPAPITYAEVGSYARPDSEAVRPAHAWSHGVSNVVQSLVDAGLNVAAFHEYPYSAIDCFPFVVADGPQQFVHRTYPRMFPLSYSVLARKAI